MRRTRRGGAAGYRVLPESGIGFECTVDVGSRTYFWLRLRLPASKPASQRVRCLRLLAAGVGGGAARVTQVQGWRCTCHDQETGLAFITASIC